MTQSESSVSLSVPVTHSFNSSTMIAPDPTEQPVSNIQNTTQCQLSAATLLHHTHIDTALLYLCSLRTSHTTSHHITPHHITLYYIIGSVSCNQRYAITRRLPKTIRKLQRSRILFFQITQKKVLCEEK